jgi:hypothetical protein
MLELAKSLPPPQLAEKAYAPYEKFRPEIPPGKKKDGGPPASWTWTSSARWLRPDPEERLFNSLKQAPRATRKGISIVRGESNDGFDRNGQEIYSGKKKRIDPREKGDGDEQETE